MRKIELIGSSNKIYPTIDNVRILPIMILDKIHKAYKENFSGEFITIEAPGRFNLIGEHTDYNNGLVLPGAIDRYMYLSMGQNDTGQCAVVAIDMDEKELFTLEEKEITSQHSWAKYLQAIVIILQERGYHTKGVNGIISSNIPVGSGLSSSAALCCGFTYGLSVLYELKIPRKEIALIAQAAEHRIGLNCGLMDQYAVLFGKKDHVLLLDCQSLEYQHYSLNLQDHTLALINSNVKHALAAESGYNERRQSCERVAAIIKKDHPHVETLRDVTTQHLQAYREKLDAVDLRRAQYVLDENIRVKATIRALQENNIVKVGELLYDSHFGLSKQYGVSCRELDLLVDLTLLDARVLGARMVGGGFGGCTINLIKNDQLEDTLDRITTAYKEQTDLVPEVISFHIGEGMQIID